jgi:hypothetical protein
VILTAARHGLTPSPVSGIESVVLVTLAVPVTTVVAGAALVVVAGAVAGVVVGPPDRAFARPLATLTDPRRSSSVG